MPKIKTNSSAKKRFKITGSGKVKFAHANHRHLMRKKSHRQKDAILGTAIIAKVDTPRALTLLGRGSNS